MAEELAPWGFALPIPPIVALVWTTLILLSWQALR